MEKQEVKQCTQDGECGDSSKLFFKQFETKGELLVGNHGLLVETFKDLLGKVPH